MSGHKIIEGLKEAVAHARATSATGDELPVVEAAIRAVLVDMLRYATDDYRDAVAVSFVKVYARTHGIELAKRGAES